MGLVLYTLYGLAHLAIAVLAIRLGRRTASWTVAVIVALAVTIAYDNLVMVLGTAIGEGDTLELLSWPRFIIHAFLTPVGVAVVVAQARRLGVRWAQAPRAMAFAWAGTAVLIAVGVRELLHLELVTEEGLGLLRYTAAEPAIPIPAIITVIVMIAVGWSLKRQTGWSLLFWLGIVTFIGSGAPPIDGMLVLGNLVEIVFVAALLVTEQRVADHAGPTPAAHDPLLADAS